MTTSTQEKKSRRSREEILALVDKAEKLISNGTPKTKAAEEVGIGYMVLQKHLGEGTKNTRNTDYFKKLEQSIREDERFALKQKVLALFK